MRNIWLTVKSMILEKIQGVPDHGVWANAKQTLGTFSPDLCESGATASGQENRLKFGTRIDDHS